MTKEEAKKFGLQLLHGIMERNGSYPVYANNVKQAIEALSEPDGSSEIPKDLEEAARKHSCYDEDCEGAWYEPIVRNAFIAGAKWQKEQMMIQWTGNNLKDVIEFTGKSPRFNEWFKSWDDYEDYVRQHGNIFKMFNDDGSHLEVPVGAWIVKTPDKRCVASKFTLKQPESEKIASAYQLGLADKEKQMMKEAVEGIAVINANAKEDGFGYVRSDYVSDDVLRGLGNFKLIIVKEEGK